MKIIIFIFLLYFSPLLGQVSQVGQKSNKADSLFLSGNKNLTYTDSLRNAVPKKQSTVSGHLYKVVWVTFVLVIFLVAGLFLYKKFVFKTNVPFNSVIKIIARQNLSPKQSIVIINIEGKKYALGVTEQQVNLITELGDINENDAGLIEDQSIGFGQILKKITTKK